MSRIVTALRNHLHFIMIAPLLIILMTWPTFRYVLDTETFWLPTRVYDVWINFWDAWHFELLMAGKAELLFTDLIFYPHGVSLAFDTPTYPQILAFNFLKAFMPLSNAYNLTYLLIIFFTALSAYIYLLYVLRHKWISLFGAVIFGCSIYVIARPSQPIVTTIATIPLSLYCFHRAVLEKRTLLAVMAGVLTGITVVIGIYTYICLVLALGFYILYFASSYWRQPGFWGRVVLVLAFAGLFGLLRAYPMIQDGSGLASALAKQDGREYNTDLIYYFFNLNHPVTTPFFRQLLGLELSARWNTSFLGYVPILLTAYGIYRSRYRRKMLFWLYLMIPFLVLRLGSFLTVNGQEFSDILLPKELLDRLLPTVFNAVYSPDFFHSVTLLPLAALSCYGLMTLLHSVAKRWRQPLIILLVALVSFEYYTSLRPTIVPDRQLAFINWLAQEAEQDAIRLINTPMGRVNAKLYDFYQTLNGYPHAEGTAGRTPDSAYDYMRANSILSTWLADKSVTCNHVNQVEYLDALDALKRDGFTHVIMHHKMWNSAAVADSFPFADAAYQDEFVSIFRMADLRASCPDHMPGQDTAAHLRDFLTSPSITVRSNESVVSLHEQAPSDKLTRYLGMLAQDWKDLVIVSPDTGQGLLVQSSNPALTSLDAIAENNSIIWLVHNAAEAELWQLRGFYDFFEARYKTCGRIDTDNNVTYQYVVQREYPCALFDSDATLSVRYESGLELAERLTRFENDRLRLYLWWSNPLDGGYAYSIQAFDEGGIKAYQRDFVIGADPLSMHTIDVDGFQRGRYSVRLIVYDYETKQSQPGVVVSTGQAFQRELEIARFRVNA